MTDITSFERGEGLKITGWIQGGYEDKLEIAGLRIKSTECEYSIHFETA